VTIGRWVLLALCALVGLGGLNLAAHGGDPATYPMGMLLFAGAVVYAFMLIKRVFDRQEGAGR
jgi:hypothetical protein